MAKSFEIDLLLKIAGGVKRLRSEKGITQEAFFHDTGIHIGRIETGKRDCSITTLARICDYFEISLEDFFKSVAKVEGKQKK